MFFCYSGEIAVEEVSERKKMDGYLRRKRQPSNRVKNYNSWNRKEGDNSLHHEVSANLYE